MRHDQRNRQIPPKEAAPAPTKMGRPRLKRIVLDRSMSATEAFAAVARGCIGHIAAAAEAARAASPRGITSITFRSVRTVTAKSYRKRAEAGASEHPAGRNLLELAARYRGPHNPPQQESAAFKVSLPPLLAARK